MDAARFDLDAVLRELGRLGGSDLHLKVGSPPLVRVDGDLLPIHPSAPPLRPSETESALAELLSAERVAQFRRERELDFAYSVGPASRYRVNAYVQRGAISLVLRVVPATVPSLESLGLPASVQALAEEPRGIVLVTGATGTGKSTTLAGMIDHLNHRVRRHVITIEDPIEYVHTDDLCSIDQREIGSDTESFNTALRQIARQDPDVIMIGEIRDEETVRVAISAAETGHLVLATLHTPNAVETINRVLDFFDPGEHQQVRAMLAGTLKGSISQRLVPAATGSGRVVVCEVLVNTLRAQDLIVDAGRTGELASVIADGEYYGMQSFDQALVSAVASGAVTLDDARRAATSPHDFDLRAQSAGLRPERAPAPAPLA